MPPNSPRVRRKTARFSSLSPEGGCSKSVITLTRERRILKDACLHRLCRHMGYQPMLHHSMHLRESPSGLLLQRCCTVARVYTCEDGAAS